MMRCFGSHEYLAPEDTTHYLRRLSGAQYEYPGSDRGIFDWLTTFARAVDSRRLQVERPLLTCGVCNALGISVDVVDSCVYQEALARESLYEPSAFHGFLASVGHHRDRLDEDMKHTLAAGNNPLGAYYCAGKFKEAAKYAISIADCERELRKQNTTTGFELSTSLHTHCALLISKYIRKLLGFVTPKDRIKLRRLSELLRLLRSSDYSQVDGIIQIASSSRHARLIAALLGTEEEKNLYVSGEDLYSEVSRLDGFSAQFLENAVAAFLLWKFHLGKGQFNACFEQILDCQRFSPIIGDRYRVRRSTTLLAALILNMPFFAAAYLKRRIWGWVSGS
jgi:hypothetical protein